MSKAPSALIFHLKRFNYKNSVVNKISRHINYPMRINLRKNMHGNGKKAVWYKLKAVVVHRGNNASKGHYVSYVENESGKWYRADDENIDEVTAQEVLRNQAYILIYNREIKAEKVELKSQLGESETNQPTREIEKEYLVNTFQVDLPTILDIQKEQRKDDKLSKIIEILENDQNRDNQKFSNFYLDKGLLMHSAFIPKFRKSINIAQIVIPLKFKAHILTAKHIAHFGIAKTYDAIREKYYWENLFSDVKHYVQSCKQCMAFKSPNKLPPVPLQRHFLATRCSQYVSLDFVGPFKRTAENNAYILTFLDHFSKYMRLYAVPNQSSTVVANCLLDYISIFGVMQYLLTDNYQSFVSDVIKQLCRTFGVQKLQICPANPKANGQSEAINKSLKKSLSIFAQENPNWDQAINFYSLCYNSSVHSVLREKPAFVQLAFDLILPDDILNYNENKEEIPLKEFVREKAAQVQKTYKFVSNNILEATKSQESYQHKKARYRDFVPGELVFLYAPERDRNSYVIKKRNFVGPLTIVKRTGKVNYIVTDPLDKNRKEFKVNAQRLIGYSARRPELDLFRSQVLEKESEITYQEYLDKMRKPPGEYEENNDQLYFQLQNISSEDTPIAEGNENILREGTRREDFTSQPLVVEDPQGIDGESILNAERQQRTSSENSPTRSEDSDKTIIYDNEGPSISEEVEELRSPYELRQIEPQRYLANRFLNWALDNTK